MRLEAVSVIVPAYNAAQYIKQTLDSAFAQTYHDFEIIVVDDGSTDDTPVIAQQFGDAIRYIRQTNQGLSAARNTAIRNARADIIALLDADDLWEPNFLEKMAHLLNQHPQAAGVYCGFQYINARGNIVGRPSLKVVPPELFHRTLIWEGNWLAPCSVLFRKQLAEEVGLFDESLRAVEDADLWIRLSTLRPFIGLPEALVRYRRHDSNMSKDPERMVSASYQLREKMFGPPEGDPTSWPELKWRAYTLLFQSGTRRYLAHGNLEKSAHYFQRLVEISPDSGQSMGLWRGLARARLPDEHQFDPDAQLDWALAQKDVMELLSELAKRAATLIPLQKQIPRIKGSAFLAMAEEAVRANDLSRAFVWWCRAAATSPSLVLSRPYWGTLARGAIKFGQRPIAKSGDS